jgi:CheY-like chemotaxis protein
MGGNCWAESTVGVGSTFFFTAKFGPAQKPNTPESANLPAELVDLPVLVVDDNATNRRILEEILIKWRARPVLADSAQAACTLLEGAAATGTPFRLAMVDWHMPEMDGFSLIEWIRANPRVGKPAILMLTSGGRPGDLARCRELDVGSYLMKPATPTELLAAAAKALKLSYKGSGKKADSKSGPSTKLGQLKILLAEDNEVNQALAVSLLEKRGHSVTVCGNGQEALDAWEGESSFDLILMDVQMPEMDGLTATSLIREREQATGAHIPIIALTAYAMKGDSERCLAAGMDAYVTKPLRTDELQRTIARLVAASASAAAGQASR